MNGLWWGSADPRGNARPRVDRRNRFSTTDPSNVLFLSLNKRVPIKSQSGMLIRSVCTQHNLLYVVPKRFDRLYSRPTVPFLKHR